jgi:hypothetical protein
MRKSHAEFFKLEEARMQKEGLGANAIRLEFNNNIVNKVNTGQMTLKEGKKLYAGIEGHPCFEGGKEYDRRVSEYEAQGMTRSDAQGVVDAEDMR